MNTVLLLGGYGGFGRRIARRLAALDYHVLVAGRDLKKAKAFCEGRSNMRPLQLDIRGGIGGVLAEEKPWAVVDAAGPFQGGSYAVAKTALSAGCHYLDIADARDFVCGIASLDEAARQAKSCAIGGASSDPCLTGAVVRRLAEGLDAVAAVEIALSVTSQASAGSSVSSAILSYAGQPIRVRRGGRWTRTLGWGAIRRETYRAGAAAPLRRLVAEIDIPSLELMPDRLPGKPSVSFRAGSEYAFQNIGLWMASRLVRWGWIASLLPMAPLFRPLQRLANLFDRGRSAMSISLFGSIDGRAVERRWTVVAEKGDGREIPCLAVPILLERIRIGEIEPGARDAGTLLELDDFTDAFSRLAVEQQVTERLLPEALYRKVMGDEFNALPQSIRALHSVVRDGGFAGRAEVVRGKGVVARLVGRIMRFPPDGAHDLHVHLEQFDKGERWTRSFGQHRFHSSFSQWHSLVVERFGPIRFGFALSGSAEGLRMRMRRWWLGPVPLPLALAPRSPAREWEEDGRFHFDVPIELPLFGPLIHYRGWLEPMND